MSTPTETQPQLSATEQFMTAYDADRMSNYDPNTRPAEEVVERFFPKNGIPLVQHNGHLSNNLFHEAVALATYIPVLEPNGDGNKWKYRSDIHIVSNHEESWVLDVFRGYKPNPHFTNEFVERASVAEVRQAVHDTVLPIYNRLQPRLEYHFPDGFNAHDTLHILKADMWAAKVLAQVKYTEEEKKQRIDIQEAKDTAIAVGGHDLGQYQIRKHHQHFSPKIMSMIFPNYDNPVVTAAVVNHEIGKVMDLHEDGDMEQTYDRLKEKGRPALALIIADKIDMGRHRTARKALESEANLVRIMNPSEDDPERNFLHDIKDYGGHTVGLVKEGNMVTWQVAFDLTGGEAAFNKETGFMKWLDAFTEAGKDQIKTFAAAHFALHPDLQYAVIDIRNNCPQSFDGTNLKLVIRRGESHYTMIADNEGTFEELGMITEAA